MSILVVKIYQSRAEICFKAAPNNGFYTTMSKIQNLQKLHILLKLYFLSQKISLCHIWKVKTCTCYNLS